MSTFLPMMHFFFFSATATTEIYTLSLHDALPILSQRFGINETNIGWFFIVFGGVGDRKSTRLNSSHGYISYAVFCLKKKKKNVVDAERPQRQVGKQVAVCIRLFNNRHSRAKHPAV